MKQYITINYERFELKKATVKGRPIYHALDIFDAYERPSYRKQCIFREWKKWAYDSEVYNFGINSYNTNIFTLTGQWDSDDGTEYYLYITPTKQEAYIIQA